MGILVLTGFCDPGSNYIKLEDITIELGDKIPQEKLNYNNYLINGDLVLEDNVPVDIDGSTIKVGTYNYFIVDRDKERKYSRLTNNVATISVVDTINPEIRIKDGTLSFDYGSKIKVSDIATCYDLSSCEMSFKSDINTKKEGKQTITIVAVDESLNTNEVTVEIKIKDKPNYYSPSYGVMNTHNNSLNQELSAEEKMNLRSQIVAYAKLFEGNPYVYGGTSLTNGIDCSAYTRAIYAKFGYKLPRSAAGQGFMGKTITKDQLLPGDLVLYHNNGSIYHVTMYIGDGKLIHAGTPQTGIQITKMWSDPRYYKRIIY